MEETLRTALKSAGWRSGTHRGFLMTSRAGIEFQVGESRAAGAGRLELRYRYHTEQTNAEGSETLPGDASLERILDAMTSIYLRVHERPDVSRVFGSRASAARRPPSLAAPNRSPEPAPMLEEMGQGALDL